MSEAMDNLRITADSLQANAIDSLQANAVIAWINVHPVLGPVMGIALLLAVAGVVLFVLRRYLLGLIGAIRRRTTGWWGEVFLNADVFFRLSWFPPLIIAHQALPFIPGLPVPLTALLQRLSLATLLVFGARAFGAFLTAIQQAYSKLPAAKDRPIKGVLQVVGVVVHLVVLVFVIAILMNRSPWILFSGLGAMTAILLLIFRDTILSLVAGIQLTANDLIRVGDWIEMPQFNADGDVIDIALNSVRVQNWDKTITVIPTHKFLENSFKNWRGMTETGGRRIKRSLYIDMSAVRFLTEEEIEHFGKFELLADYIAEKRLELEEYNSRHPAGSDIIANPRRLTNIGTLRAYMINYLRQHPGIHQGLTLLVRQLQPTAEGLPLEIYTFTSDIRWANYEGVQGDIFDHVLALLPEFGLRVFQKPSGHDLHTLVEERRFQTA